MFYRLAFTGQVAETREGAAALAKKSIKDGNYGEKPFIEGSGFNEQGDGVVFGANQWGRLSVRRVQAIKPLSDEEVAELVEEEDEDYDRDFDDDDDDDDDDYGYDDDDDDEEDED